MDAADPAALALESEHGTRWPQADVQGRAAGDKGFCVTGVPQLGRIRQMERSPQVPGEARLQMEQVGLGQRLTADAGAAPFLVVAGLVAVEQFQAAATQVAIVDAGPLVQFLGERRKGLGAEGAEAVEGGAGRVRVPGRDDAGTRPGRLLAEVAPLHNLDGHPLAGQGIGHGQSDDAAAQDQDIGVSRHEGCYSKPLLVRS